MLKKALFFSAFIMTLLFQGCSDSTSSSDEASQMLSGKSYTLKDTDGKSYTVLKEGNNFALEGHKDKVVLYDIFATWCPPCRAAAPALSNLQKRYAKDVLFLGVTIEDDKSNDDILAFKKEYGADYTIVNSKDNIALSRAIASSIKVGQRFPIPLMVMYKNGNYITHYVGAIPEEMIESDIKKALGK